jgi:hypothetical protein
MTIPYVYKELPLNSFRVLELLPAAEHESLAVCLHQADWTDPPKYEAISYAWGNSSTRVSILCDGCVLYISPSLSSALTQFRRSDSSRFLWADAIWQVENPACQVGTRVNGTSIDQSNIKERGYQVSNMIKIYKQATQVLAYLGPDNEDKAGPAMQAIDKIITSISNSNKLRIRDLKTLQEYRAAKLDLVVDLGKLLENNHTTWVCLKWIFSRPWYSRGWVLQEAVVNPRVRVICGQHEEHLFIFAMVARCINNSRLWYSFAHEMRGKYGWNMVVMLSEIQINGEDVLQTLETARQFLTSDDRDKVYALLGILSPSLELRNIKADYSKSVMQVYEDVAMAHINHTKGLKILAHADCRDTLKSPTWIPDWRNQTLVMSISGNGLGWNASKSMSLSISQVSNHVITISGIALDSITFKSDKISGGGLFPWPGLNTEILKEDILFWEYHLGNTARYSDDVETITAYAETFSGGRTNFSSRADSVKQGRDFSAYLLQYLREDHKLYPTVAQLAHGGDESAYRKTAGRVLGDKRMFRTASGYIGLGAHFLEPGDLICILFGGHVPYVLRPEGDHFLFIGEAYVHKIMHGEAVDEWQNNKSGIVKEHEFALH